MTEHRTVVDDFLTDQGWRYQAVCSCRWIAPTPSPDRATAASVGREHKNPPAPPNATRGSEMSATQQPTMTREEINGLVAGETINGYRMVADDETGEDWRHGIRRLTVVTADDVTFWAIERRVPTSDLDEWSCRDQHGPDFRLRQVWPEMVVTTRYRRHAPAA